MNERQPLNREDSDGNVVPIDNTDPIENNNRRNFLDTLKSPEGTEVIILANVLGVKALAAKYHHPTMGEEGKSVKEARESHIGEAAQAALDAYKASTAQLILDGENLDRSTGGPHFRVLLDRLNREQTAGLYPRSQVQSVLALVRQGVVRQRSNEDVEPVYDDFRLRASHN